MKTLYCFDFDGTLTKGDTMFSFLKFYNPIKFYVNFVYFLPQFLLLKLKLVSAEKTKQNFIFSILKNGNEKHINQMAMDFFEQNYPKIIRKKALNFIESLDREKSECFLVTASLDIWTRPFAEKFQFKLLATESCFKDGFYTKHFNSKNCNEQEKVARVLQEIQFKKYKKTIAFGDSSGDLPMLNWADEGHFKYFH